MPGSWYWVDDQNAHWRPEKYYAPGTTVTVDANLYGTPLGDGLYGAEDEQVSFKIGDAHVSIADDNTKQVSVFDNGKLVRTMPTSMGMGGTQTIGGTTLSFFTPPGVYTVLDKANPVVMDSSTFGLPIDSRLGYKESIPYATRISIDGIYLHQLNSTVWAQGNTDTSHGCLNLNGDNAAVVLRLLRARRRRRGHEHRRRAAAAVAERRLDRAVGSVAPGQQARLGRGLCARRGEVNLLQEKCEWTPAKGASRRGAPLHPRRRSANSLRGGQNDTSFFSGDPCGGCDNQTPTSAAPTASSNSRRTPRRRCGTAGNR